MNSLRRCLLFVFLFACASIQAKDFSTNGFTFNIPAAWTLNDKIFGDIYVQFDIKTTNGIVPVRFKGYNPGNTNGTVPSLVDTWKKFLENPDNVAWQTHSHSINGREITYVEASGALKYYSKALKKEIYVHNYSFFGAVLNDPRGNVSIYMLGRTSVTDKLKPQFKALIEEAVANKTK